MKDFLEGLYTQYHRKEFLGSDPLEIVHRYSGPVFDQADQETVALIAALLAYGNVKQIRASVESLLQRLDHSADRPSLALGADRRVFRGWVHRFNRGDDLWLLLRLLARSWKEHGSLGAHLGQYMKPGVLDFSEALDQLIREWKKWALELGPRSVAQSDSFGYLLTTPHAGSTCKRWCMLMRWMVRKDELDLGLWSEWIRPDQLVMPLDTHTGRISQKMKFTKRKSLNWKASLEVTRALKKYDAADPVKYDFAICRIGMFGVNLDTIRK